MKQLIRRLSRVADSSSEYSSLLSSSSYSHPRRRRRRHHAARRVGAEEGVPEGHVPVYVGEEMERFAVSAEVLNHPVFVGLLNRSAQEYGYAQKGVIHIPCHVIVFERVVDTLRMGISDPRELRELLDDLSLWVSGATE